MTASDDTLSSLVTTLRELVALLDRVGADHWAAWMRRSAQQIEAGDPRGLQHLLNAFGGMGSLSDLVISAENGHAIAPAESATVNQTLSRIREQVWRHATALNRDINSL